MCKKWFFLVSPILLVLALAGSAWAGKIDPASVTDGHVYLFEDVGADVPDDSANNNTANLVGNPQVVDGLNGKALQFDGIDDGVHIPDSAMINLSTHQNHTVVAVFKCDDVAKTDKQVVYEEGGTTRGLVIYVHEGLVYAGGWNLSDYTPEWTGTFLSAPISTGAWYAVAMVVREGGAAQEDDRFEMWMNGELIGMGPGAELRSRSNDCGIGYANAQTKFHDGNFTGGGSYFAGAVDEVWIINQALTISDLSTLMGKAWPYAYGPSPADGAMHEDTWISLSWKPGDLAVSHDVYLGDKSDDVNDATRESELFRGNQETDFYVAGFPGYAYPDGLVPGTSYYWRIDEVNDADPNSPWKGDIWSFSIPPRTAYNPSPADGAEFVATDVTLSWTPGFGAKLHTVYIGTDFDTVNSAAGGVPLGMTEYKPAAPLELEKVYYWRVDEFDGAATHKGNVWAFTTPGAAGNPQPANRAAGVQMVAKLSWTPAATAVSHDVYFGTDKDGVRNATKASPEYKGNKALGDESLDPGKLAWHSDYYWRVDAVYNTGAVKGLVWSFTTADFITVDDFESYNDIDPPDAASHRIFDAWIDGFADPATNGALVGNDLPPYAEQTVVHSGAQSMPYRYDNANKTSEATLTLVYPRDWTEEGVGQLSLWFRGDRANSAERMYVALNGNAVVYHDDSAATQKSGWTRWVIDLQAFQGVTLTNVNTMAIGFGTKGSPAAGGAGKMYFDDIRLYRP